MGTLHKINFGGTVIGAETAVSVSDDAPDAYEDKLAIAMAPDKALPAYLNNCSAADTELALRLTRGLGSLATVSDAPPKNPATS